MIRDAATILTGWNFAATLSAHATAGPGSFVPLLRGAAFGAASRQQPHPLEGPLRPRRRRSQRQPPGRWVVRRRRWGPSASTCHPNSTAILDEPASIAAFRVWNLGVPMNCRLNEAAHETTCRRGIGKKEASSTLMRIHLVHAVACTVDTVLASISITAASLMLAQALCSGNCSDGA